MHTEQEVRSRIANLINVEDIYSDEIEDILDSWSENRCEPGLSFHDEIEAAIDDPKYANGEEDPEYYAFWDLLGNKSDEEILSVVNTKISPNKFVVTLYRTFQEENAGDGLINDNIFDMEISKTPELNSYKAALKTIYSCAECAYHRVFENTASEVVFEGTSNDLFTQVNGQMIPATDEEIKEFEAGTRNLWVGYLKAEIEGDGEMDDELAEEFADKRNAQRGNLKSLVNY